MAATTGAARRRERRERPKVGKGPLTADPAGLVRRMVRQLTAWDEPGLVEQLRKVCRRHVPGAQV